MRVFDYQGNCALRESNSLRCILYGLERSCELYHLTLHSALGVGDTNSRTTQCEYEQWICEERISFRCTSFRNE